jgi:hypothetical protein
LVSLVPYIACDPSGSPPAASSVYVPVSTGITDPPLISMAATLSPPADRRYFSLPPDWLLFQADWRGPAGLTSSPPGDPVFSGNGSYDKATGRISQTAVVAADIGAADAPVVFILDPHWKYFRFQFFDRYYGDAHLQSPPTTTAHKKRISVPPVCVEGFRADVDAAGSAADTISNWSIGADTNEAAQCVPWILVRDSTGTALPAMTGATMGLRIRTHETLRTFIYSKSDTARELCHLDPANTKDAALLKPSANRLKYYDLPRIWKSRKYYTRGLPTSPPPGAKYFDKLTTEDLDTANTRTTPLMFSFDDIVLVDDSLNQIALTPNQRVTLFHHKFRKETVASPPVAVQSGVTITNEGVYKPGTLTDSVTDAEGYPFSKIDIPVRYYISDYPDWTRLLIAQGNFFDVFEDRTPDVIANDVVGARAAVRWVDATTMPNGKPPAGIAASNGRVSPRPGVDNRPFFSVQPYYWQRYLSGYNEANPETGPLKHIEWTNRYGSEQDSIGRLDIALLRCADWDGTDEVSVMVRYNRLTFDYTSAGTNPNPMLGVGNDQRMVWVDQVINGSLARWNGHDAYNDARPWVLPRQASPPTSPPAQPPAVKVHVVTMLQYLKGDWAHFNVKIIDVDGTSSMGEVVGSGGLRINTNIHDAGPDGAPDAFGAALSNRGLAASHEFGHCGSLPDEYGNDERYTDKCLLGCPYIFEAPPARGLMNYNWYIRARYFWHAAEWLRLLPDFRTVDFKISRVNPLAPGANAESDFHLPHYPHDDSSPPVYRARNFVCWPVSFNLHAHDIMSVTYYDSVLYMLGEDKYSTEILPDRLGGGARVDGILVILVRFFVDLSGLPGNNRFKNRFMEGLQTSVRQQFDTKLNASRTADFQLMNGTRRDPQFSRCLLEFVPAFTTDNGEAGSSPQHIDLSFATFVPALMPPILQRTWTVNAPLGPNTLEFNVPNNLNTAGAVALNSKVNAIAAKMFDRCCENLGLNPAIAPALNSYQTPASFKNIVKTVMHDAAPDPTIT